MAFSLSYKDRVQVKTQKRIGGLDVTLLHRAGCQVCPLNHSPGNKHPHMEPFGPTQAPVYILGEAPGEKEDKRGRPFVGPAGQALYLRIPDKWIHRVRLNNVVRTRPPDNRDPSPVEIECCRPSVAADIELMKPKVIIGTGEVPLRWASNETGISRWRGRRLPVKVGEHTAWLFPVFHPSFILRKRKWEPRSADSYGCDEELAFAHDIRRAFALVDKLPEPVVHDRDRAMEGLHWVTGHGADDVDTVINFIEECKSADITGFDYETNAKRPYTEGAKILTVAMSIKGMSLAFPLYHPGAGWSEKNLKRVWDALLDFFNTATCRIAVHNLAFELEWTGFFFGTETVRGPYWEDTQSQAFIRDERTKMGSDGPLSLKFLTVQYFGIDIKQLSHVDVVHLINEPLESVLSYNALDAKYHRLLCAAQDAALELDGLTDVYYEHLRRVPTMVLTQLQGVPIDMDTVHKLDTDYLEKMKKQAKLIEETELAKRFRARYGHQFRPSANDDVAKILKLAGIIDAVKSDASELIKLKDDPLRKPLETWKQLAKAHSTYVKPQLTRLYPDGMLHPIIATTSTTTWRTASEEPNSQNWPKRNPEHKKVRAQIRAPRGHKMVSFDYGQIQARNVAMESMDDTFIQTLWDDYDIHAEWRDRIAAAYNGWVPGGIRMLKEDSMLASSLRHLAKNRFVFPLLFGAFPSTLSRHLKIPEKVCAKLSDDFWEVFGGIHQWQQSLHDNVQKYGYVTGHTGFRRRVPMSKNEIINAPIQADEAAIVCDAMTRLSEIGLQATMEIHDDLTFIWPNEEIDDNTQKTLEIMLFPPWEWTRTVPILVEVAIGEVWSELKEVGKYRSDQWAA